MGQTGFRAVPARFIVRLISVVVLAVIPLSLPAADLTIGAVINVAGRQRMLTQRITSSYLQIGLNANPRVAGERLRNSIEQFETQLAILKSASGEEKIVTALGRVEEQWPTFKDAALQPVSKEGGMRLAALDENLLDACEQVVSLLQDSAGEGNAALVNLAGRQRMLSQRLARLYMIEAYGLGSAGVTAKIQNAKAEFKAALAQLRASPANSTVISETLDAAELQWTWLESALEVQQDTYFPLIVADASEKLLELMESLTELYSRTAV